MKKLLLTSTILLASAVPAFAADLSQTLLNVQEATNDIYLNAQGGPTSQELSNTANAVIAKTEDLRDVTQLSGEYTWQYATNTIVSWEGDWEGGVQSIANTLNVAVVDEMRDGYQTSNSVQYGLNLAEIGDDVIGNSEAKYDQDVANVANIVQATDVNSLTQTLAGLGQEAHNHVDSTGFDGDGNIQKITQNAANTANVAVLTGLDFAAVNQTAAAPQWATNYVFAPGNIDHVNQIAGNVANVLTIPSPVN